MDKLTGALLYLLILSPTIIIRGRSALEWQGTGNRIKARDWLYLLTHPSWIKHYKSSTDAEKWLVVYYFVRTGRLPRKWHAEHIPAPGKEEE